MSVKIILNNSVYLLVSLGKADLADNQVVLNLKAELKEAEQDLKSAREETTQMEEKLQQSKEEVGQGLL